MACWKDWLSDEGSDANEASAVAIDATATAAAVTTMTSAETEQQ